MGENSSIEWCHHTFNPWIGCQNVSAGCTNCYAERDFQRKPRWSNCWGPPENTERKRTSEANWKKPLAWNRKAEAEGERKRVFCASLADVFEEAPGLDVMRDDLWRLIEQTPWLDWLLLTKRPENVIEMAPYPWPENACLGFSAENQAMLDRRAKPALEAKEELGIPVLFVSAEPLLGPLYMRGIDIEFDGVRCCADILEGGLTWFETRDIGSELMGEPFPKVDWVIVGGESGPNARPAHPDWVRGLRDQCLNTGVPFFFKQWGEWIHESHAEESLRPTSADGLKGLMDDGKVCTLDGDTFFWRVGKKKAGRLLDGREWNEFPFCPF